MLVASDGFEIVPEYTSVTEDYEIFCIKRNFNLFAVLYGPPNGYVERFLAFFLLDTLLCFSNQSFLFLGENININ